MSKSTKTASVKSATPAKTQAKKPAKTKVAARPEKAAATMKPPKPITREPAFRKSEVGLEQRRHYVEVAAYFIAERHGFTPGHEYEDWGAAEAEIDRLLAEGLLNT